MKLNIEEFRKKKIEIINLKNELDKIDVEIFKKNFLVFYYGLERDLLSYDLSDIPSSEWEGITILADENNVMDLSKTKANVNIDQFKNFKYVKLSGLDIVKNIRKKIIDGNLPLDINIYNEEFIDENKDLFLIDVEIPKDVKKNFFRRTLSIKEFIEYEEIFNKFPIDNFLNLELEISQTIKENYPLGEYQKIILKYKDFFYKLSSIRDLITFNYYFIPEANLEESFIKAAKKYIINYRWVDDTLKMPEWARSLNFDIIENLTNVEELFNYNYNTFLKNLSREKIIQYFTPEYLKKLEEETNLFSKSNFEIFNIIEKYILESKLEINYSKPIKNYEEFEKKFLLYLEINRKLGNFYEIIDYNLVTKALHKKYPELFLDQEIPLELKELFNSGNLNVKSLYFKDEYIKYLKDKNLIELLKLRPFLLPSEGQYFSSYNKSFFEKYIELYGNENFLKLCTEYGPFVSYIGVLNQLEIDDNKEVVDKRIMEAIYNVILSGRTYFDSFHYKELEKNKNFFNKYKDLFVDFKEILNLTNEENEMLKNLCYEGLLKPEYIKDYPKLKEYLKDKRLFLFFQKDINSSNLIIELGKDKFLSLAEKFGKYIDAVTIQDIKNLNNTSNLEEDIKNIIIKKCLSGEYIYEENVPFFLKENAKDLFLREDAPEELKKYFYANEGKYLDFKILKENFNEWKEYLTKEQIKLAILKNPATRNQIKEYLEKFGLEKALRLALKNPDNVNYMIEHSYINILDLWYSKTGETFVPNKTIMLNFPEEDIDKFLISGKYWSTLMRLEDYSLTQNKTISLIKLSYLFGIFDQDKKGFDNLYAILTSIPKIIYNDQKEIVEKIKNDVNNLFREELEKTLTKDKIEFVDGNLFDFFYKKDDLDNYKVKINFDLCPNTGKLFRKIIQKYNELPILTPDKVEKIFFDFPYKNDEKFREFFIKNLDSILRNHNENSALISDVAKNFEKIRIINSNRKLTLNRAISYISSANYENINYGNEALARTSLLAGYKDEDFEILQRIYNIGKTRCLSSIPRIENKYNGYSYEMLRLDDPTHLTIGEFTTCCQKLSNAGETCMEHSMLDKNGRVFVVKDKVGNVVAQSWVWRNGDTLCFDNIEVPNLLIKNMRSEGKNLNEFSSNILKIYKKAGEELIKIDSETYKSLLELGKITKEEYEILRLKRTTFGLGCNDIIKELKENLDVVKPEETLQPFEYTPVFTKKDIYLSDSMIQFVLSGEEEVSKEHNRENLYVYNDQYIEYTDSNFNSFDTYKALEKITKEETTNISEGSNFIINLELKNNLDPQKTRIVMNSNFAILYEKDEDKIKIADLLFNTKIENHEQVIDIEDEVALQINLALKQISEDKRVELLNLDENQKDMYEKALKAEINIRKK